MKIHKLTWVLLIGLLLLSACSTEQPNLYLSANAAAVYSVENGEALYEKKTDKVMPIASLTKLMTAFLVLEAVDNNELSWDEKLNLVRLDDPSAVSTTKDLFLLSSKLISTHPEVLETTSKPTVTTDKGAKLESTNDSLGSIQGLDGLKTGFTDEAGYCFIGTAERGGKRVISIVLDAGTAEKRFKDTEKLMEVGFKED
ncbi:D-alanyl-D-alanine carboxypeptidase family protein [Listeria seeligeri]|uniref:D-alanyl-D-alanine carboxypeptidase family protein n=1 Tax=Listeria seeligeri TaxID=1640 RepID=UPI0022EBE551|nr:serine hydrolase [Listeria seeligeri]